MRQCLSKWMSDTYCYCNAVVDVLCAVSTLLDLISSTNLTWFPYSVSAPPPSTHVHACTFAAQFVSVRVCFIVYVWQPNLLLCVCVCNFFQLRNQARWGGTALSWHFHLNMMPCRLQVTTDTGNTLMYTCDCLLSSYQCSVCPLSSQPTATN